MSPRTRDQMVVVLPAQRWPLRDRLTRATLPAVVAVGIVWGAFNHDQLTPINLDPAPRGPVQANHELPQVDLTPTTTTAPSTTATTAPTTTTTPPQTTTNSPAIDPDAAPPGAYPTPEQAARTWYAHRGNLPTNRIQVLQRDRRDRDTFRVLVLAEKNHRVHTALLRVVRVDGNYWKTVELINPTGGR